MEWARFGGLIGVAVAFGSVALSAQVPANQEIGAERRGRASAFEAACRMTKPRIWADVGGDVTLAPALTDVSIWAFHGGADKVVPTFRSQSMVAAIRAAGGRKIRYREYPGVGHVPGHRRLRIRTCLSGSGPGAAPNEA